MKRKLLAIISFLQKHAIRLSLDSDDLLGLSQAKELLLDGNNYINRQPVELSIRANHDSAIDQEEGTIACNKNETYGIKVFRDKIQIAYSVRGGNKNGEPSEYSFSYSSDTRKGSRSFYCRTKGRHISKREGFTSYLSNFLNLLNLPFATKLDYKRVGEFPHCFIDINPIRDGLIVYSSNSLPRFSLLSDAKIDPDFFLTKEIVIPDRYLVNKPQTLGSAYSFELFVQVLEEAAAADDLETICELWQTACTSSGYSDSVPQFPGVILATCEIVDEEGGLLGSEWYNVGVISTQTERNLVLFIDGFSSRSFEYLDTYDVDEQIDLTKVLEQFEEKWQERVNEYSGLDPYLKVYAQKEVEPYSRLLS